MARRPRRLASLARAGRPDPTRLGPGPAAVPEPPDGPPPGDWLGFGVPGRRRPECRAYNVHGLVNVVSGAALANW